MLAELEQGILDYRIDGKDVPVKLRAFDSLFVPFAKWAMLATGNYRCIQPGDPIAIRDAVHGDVEKSGFFDRCLPSCTRQATRSSTGPQVDLASSFLRHRLGIGDIGELQHTAGSKDAPRLVECADLVWAQVEHAV